MLFHRLPKPLPIICLALLLPSAQAADATNRLEAFCEAHTRVVWIQDAGDTACVFSERPTLRLMAFDSKDGRGERPVLKDIARYWQPLISDDGSRIMYGDLEAKTVNIVNWDGTQQRVVLKDAHFEDVWTDPVTGIEWFYASREEKRGDKTLPVIRRYHLADPSISELVWDKLPIHHFMVSGDGRSASGGGDGGNSPQGVLTLPNGQFAQRAGGCWPSMAPDNSMRSWVFTGNHRSIHFGITTDRSGKGYCYGVNFDKTPGLELTGQEELYHPRWTNDVRFITATAPLSQWSYQAEAKIPNDVAAKVEIYIGKFNDDMKSLEGWLQVTNNDRGDYWPNAWVKPASGKPAWLDASVELAAADDDAELDTKQQVFVWETGASANQLEDASTSTIKQCSGDFRGSARFERYHRMDLFEGAFIPKDSAEEWLTRIRSNKAMSIEVVIEPQAAGAADGSRILEFGNNIQLSQIDQTLVLQLRDDEPRPLAQLGKGPLHLVVSYQPGNLRLFINGQIVTLPTQPSVDFTSWKDAQLIFGDAWDGGHNWAGLMEGIGLFGRSMDFAEARLRSSRFVERNSEREQATPQVVIEGSIIEGCPAADPKGIAPYRRCLSLQQFRVDKILSGTCEDKIISVAQWSVLDGKVVDAYHAYKPGTSHRLVLENWAHHPEQESERMISGDFIEEGDLYYQVRETSNYQAPEKSSAIPAHPGSGWQKKSGSLILEEAMHISGQAKPDLFAVAGKKDTHGHNISIINQTLDEVAITDQLRLGGAGSLRAIAVVDGGTGFTTAPSLSIEGDGKGAQAIALMSLEGFDITGLGSGYSNETHVLISQPDMLDGLQAEAKAIIAADTGSLERIHITNPGRGYIQAPSIQLVDEKGQGAKVQALLSISAVQVITPGTGYNRQPTILITGNGTGGSLKALFQSTNLRYTGEQSKARLVNTGSVDQDAAGINFDWAASQNNSGKREWVNNGEWVLRNGAVIEFASSTARPHWFGGLVNSGTLRVLNNSHIGLQNIDNSGTLELGAGAVFGNANLGEAESVLINRGQLLVKGDQTGKPAQYGIPNRHRNNKRTIENGGGDTSRCQIGDGKTVTTLEVTGGEAFFHNQPKASLDIAAKGNLALLTNDAGSQHLFNSRSAVINNDGSMRLAGRLTVLGNQAGFTGIRNQGQLVIAGSEASIMRLPNSAGPGSAYLAEALSRIHNLAGGQITGNGTLTYLNETGSPQADLLQIQNEGTLAIDGGFTCRNIAINNTGTIGLNLNTKAKENTAQLNLTGEGKEVRFSLGKESCLDIRSPQKLARGTYRIISAPRIEGTFSQLTFNGKPSDALSIIYGDDAIDVVVK